MTTLRTITNFHKSDEYRKQIHNLIPGGAHTYSKGDDQFPERSPAAIERGDGAMVYDIDGNEFLDCSMGLTSVSLGHAYPSVVQRVKEELDRGVNFQRPSVLEKEMAEEFLKLVGIHDMIKFTKNGSTATTAAVKLARAFTGRELVCFPSDHPFYSYDDWFIGKTSCDKGVPEVFKNFTLTYNSLDLKTLEELFLSHPNKIACVISEPEKQTPLPENYLDQIIELCHAHGALFILDEMITGFKTDFPGSIKKCKKHHPDMATWGKGIANGFSFSALTGKKEIMEIGGINRPGKEKVFLVSTTHGGETHAMAACLQTIHEFKKHNVVSHNQSIGQRLIDGTKTLIADKKLTAHITVSPTNWMVAFGFLDKENNPSPGLRTLFMQEMIARGVLFQGVFVPCYSHTNEHVDYFLLAFRESLDVYVKALENGYEKYLIGHPAKAVFRKYL